MFVIVDNTFKDGGAGKPRQVIIRYNDVELIWFEAQFFFQYWIQGFQKSKSLFQSCVGVRKY